MNRKQKRNFIKIARKKGVGEEFAKAFISIKENKTEEIFSEKIVNTGDKVKLNVDEIISSKIYKNKMSEYKKFVENSVDVIYTAKVENDNFVSLEEKPEWLFRISDLIVLSEE